MKTSSNFRIKTFFYIVVVASFLSASLTASAQFIVNISFLPMPATQTDTVHSVITAFFYENTYPNQIELTDYTINILDTNITVNLFYDVSGFWTGFPGGVSIDTVSFGCSLSPGQYSVTHISNTWLWNQDTLNPIYDTNNNQGSNTSFLQIGLSGYYSPEADQCNFKIFPNPAQDYITIEYDLKGEEPPATLSIIDNIGRTVKEIILFRTIDQIIFPLRDLAAGSYMLKINKGQRLMGFAKFSRTH